MLVLTRNVPVNPPGASAALTREQVWAALVRLADDPACAVPGATCACKVLERGVGSLVREVDVQGERSRERVTFQAPDRVRVVRLSGPARGATEQALDTGPGGRLVVRLTSAIELEGVAVADERVTAEALFDAEAKAVEDALRAARG